MRIWRRIRVIERRMRRSRAVESYGIGIMHVIHLLLVAAGVMIWPSLPRTATALEWVAWLWVFGGLLQMIWNLGAAVTGLERTIEDGQNGPRLRWARVNIVHELLRIVSSLPIFFVLLLGLAAPATAGDVSDSTQAWALAQYRVWLIPALLSLIIGKWALSYYDMWASWLLIRYTARYDRVTYGRRKTDVGPPPEGE